MRNFYNNSVAKKISEMNQGLENYDQGFKNETTARTALKLLITPKEWAGRLEVSHQKANAWIRGEPIPTERIYQIAEHAKLIYINELNPNQAEVDMMLMMQFGKCKM